MLTVLSMVRATAAPLEKGGTERNLPAASMNTAQMLLANASTEAVLAPSLLQMPFSRDIQTVYPAHSAGPSHHRLTEQNKMFPAKPGLEEAYAYACLQDPGAYEFATVLLDKMDTIIGKMYSQAALANNTEGVAKTVDNERYTAVYGENPLEIGTSGRDPVQIQKVIAARSPEQGIQLRQKMALIHHIMEWFPHEVQRAAGLETYESSLALKLAQATMTDQETKARHDKMRAYIETLQLDFPVSAVKMADFCQWWMLSDTVRASYHTRNEELTPHGRKMNPLFFEERDDVRDILDRTPWKRLPLEANRTVNLAMADNSFNEFVQNATLDEYQPRYEQVQTDLLNGSCYFVLNEKREWFQDNFQNENLIVKTGPSGTEDILQRLADIFEMPIGMKINGVKAASAHMHLDEHHSLHEIFSATDGNPELNKLLQYDGTLASIERLDPKTFSIAKAIQAQFLEIEIEKRNRLENHRRLAFGTDHAD